MNKTKGVRNMALTLIVISCVFFLYCYATREDTEKRYFEYLMEDLETRGGKENE